MEISQTWREIFDMLLFLVYLVFSLGAAFVILYFLGVEVMGFDVGMTEAFTMVGLTLAIFFALIFINLVKLRQWWERL